MEKFMIMKISQSIAFSLVLFASNAAFAGSDLDKQAYQISAFGQPIASQVDIVKQKIAQIEYVELSNQDRVKLNDDLDSLVDGGLSEAERNEVIGRVNAMLSKSFADSKLVCTFEKPMGSNQRVRACMTQAAKRRAYDKTQLDMVNRRNSDLQRIN